jgi:hypothetical protein
MSCQYIRRKCLFLPSFLAVKTISACDWNTTTGNDIIIRYGECSAFWDVTCVVKPQFTGNLRFLSVTGVSECHPEVNIYDNINQTTSTMVCVERTSIVFSVTPGTVLSMIPNTVKSTAAKSYRKIKIYQGL